MKDSASARVRTRTFFALAFVVCLVVAGLASSYSSALPDGLEYVAEQTGFLSSGQDSATAGSPLADYQTSGVDDDRVSGALAGLIGVALVALLGGALFWVLRRRPPDEDGS